MNDIYVSGLNERAALGKNLEASNHYRLEQKTIFFSEATDIQGDFSPTYIYWSKMFVEAKLLNLFGARDAVKFYVSSICDNRKKSTQKSILRVFLMNGWSSTEPMGVWSNDDQSTISILLTQLAPSQDLVLTIESCGNIFPEKPMQTVDVNVKGSRVWVMQFTCSGAVEVFSLQIGQTVNKADMLHIECSCDDVCSPSKLNLSNSIRRIAFFLHSLQINVVVN